MKRHRGGWHSAHGMPASLAQKAPSTYETPEPTLPPSQQPNPRKIAFPDGSRQPDRPWENESPRMNAAIPEPTGTSLLRY